MGTGLAGCDYIGSEDAGGRLAGHKALVMNGEFEATFPKEAKLDDGILCPATYDAEKRQVQGFLSAAVEVTSKREGNLLVTMGLKEALEKLFAAHPTYEYASLGYFYGTNAEVLYGYFKRS